MPGIKGRQVASRGIESEPQMRLGPFMNYVRQIFGLLGKAFSRPSE